MSDSEKFRQDLLAGICPFCGRGPFRSVVVHTSQVHEVDGREVRDMAGLIYSHPLAAPDVLARYAESAREQGMDMEALQKKRGKKRAVSIAERAELPERLGGNQLKKLTSASVTEIRAARAGGERSIDVAERYGVSPATIRSIWAGRNWRGVTS